MDLVVNEEPSFMLQTKGRSCKPLTFEPTEQTQLTNQFDCLAVVWPPENYDMFEGVQREIRPRKSSIRGNRSRRSSDVPALNSSVWASLIAVKGHGLKKKSFLVAATGVHGKRILERGEL